MSMGRRVGELERRIRERSPGRRDGAARERMKDLLGRYAAAKQAGGITEELEAEFRSARGALGAREGFAGPRGEGYR